jgi:pyruvate/2-oxoglutarate dehydrogenase complex dihydrolipoamide dehydrogenase (E3) component
MRPFDYPNLGVGAGEAGNHIAPPLAGLDERAFVIERFLPGGSCPKGACLPGARIIYSAKEVSLLGRAAVFGGAADSVKTDAAVIFQRNRQMVERLLWNDD